MKITHVAEIVNITNVAGILEAEICVAENMRAVLMYNPKKAKKSKVSLLTKLCCRSEVSDGWSEGLKF